MSAPAPTPASAPTAGLRTVAPLLLAVFLSGAAALVYETVWTRSFAIVLGSTVEAASATFAAFLVGLAAGAWWLGRFTPPLRFTVAAYIAIELCVAVLAPLCGLLLHRHADALALAIGAGPGPRALWAFATVLAIVLLPTFAMGGTFPLMLLAARRLGAPLPAVGRLYALNTFGAAAGTLTCGFLLIRWVGVERSLWVGGAANLLAAIACVPLLRRGLRAETRPEPADVAARGDFLPEPLLLGVAATSGMLVLGLEVVWTRLASYFLGNRTYAFTTLLACVLLMLAAGSWLASRLVERAGRGSRELFGWVLVAGMGCSIASATAAWWWIGHQSAIEARLPAREELLLFYRAAQAFLLLAPSLVTLGCLFPLSLMCSRHAAGATGRAAGRFYAANTAGAVVGSLAVGFWGSRALGAFGSTAALVGIGSLLALAVFALAIPVARRRATLAGAGTALALLLLTPALLPARLSVVPADQELVFRREDERGVLQVLRVPGGLIRATNNRTDLVYPLGLASTSFVQEMQGHLALFHRPASQRVAVIGSGYGVTAGALTRYPEIRRIDAVEILPGLIEAAELFRPFNHAYHLDPRVSLIVDDGRHFLVRSDGGYDVISVNVSDPQLPGGSSLFHREFYEIVTQKLAPGGILVQHVFGPSREIILKTLLDAFADLRLYPAYGNGYNVIASQAPLDRDPAAADALLAVPSVEQALHRIGMLPPVTPSAVLRAAIRREEILRGIRPGTPPATDDRPRLEFAWGDGARVLFSND